MILQICSVSLLFLLTITGIQTESENHNLNTFSLRKYRIIETTDKKSEPDPQIKTQHSLEKRSSFKGKQSSEAKENENETSEGKAGEGGYRKTEAKEHPYAVGIHLWVLPFESSTPLECSGSLLTFEWVLTAAHCLAAANHLVVYAGMSNLTEAYEMLLNGRGFPEGSQMIDDLQTYVHPHYDKDTFRNDVGLIRLKGGGFNRSQYVDTVKLSTQPFFSDYRGCNVTGFGALRQAESSPDDHVRKTETIRPKPCPCSADIGSHLGTNTDRFACTKPNEDHGACFTDSGSGLVCNGEVKAVTSFSLRFDELMTCQLRNSSRPLPRGDKCGDANELDVFTDICPVLSWINSHIRLFDGSEVAPECCGCRTDKFEFLMINPLLGLVCPAFVAVPYAAHFILYNIF